MVAFSVLFIVINDYLLVTRGPTVAKWMLGIRIVDYATGGDSPLVKVLGARYIVFLALQSIPIIGGLIGLVDILFFFGDERRCLHDLLVGTKVITNT